MIRTLLSSSGGWTAGVAKSTLKTGLAVAGTSKAVAGPLVLSWRY